MSPISVSIRAPVLGPTPGRELRMRPKGWASKSSPISAPSRSRRCCVRSSSVATSAITRPIATEPSTTTVWASRASVTASVSAFARRGERFRSVGAMRPRPAVASACGVG